MLFHRQSRTAARANHEEAPENRTNRSSSSGSGIQKRRQFRNKNSIQKVLLVLAAVVIIRMIDFRAVLEHPDPIQTTDTEQEEGNNRTIILMIETRHPPPDSVCINELYADRHGYDFDLITRHWCFDEYGNRFGKYVYLWCRPLIFKDVLEQYTSLFYLDSDAYFVNPDLSLGSFFSHAEKNGHFALNPERHETNTFVGAEDCGTPRRANGGIQFWRKTRFSNRMLTAWFLLYRRQFIFYWLRTGWLSNYEIHHFSNRRFS